jgi:hypothetical protein
MKRERFRDNRSPSGGFTTMCRCLRGGSSENTSTKSSMDDSEVSLVRSRLARFCCKWRPAGMETFQRVRESASMCWSAIFLSLMASLRVPTGSELEILIGRTWVASSPKTQQLSLSVAAMTCCFVDARISQIQTPTSTGRYLSVIQHSRTHTASRRLEARNLCRTVNSRLAGTNQLLRTHTDGQ